MKIKTKLTLGVGLLFAMIAFLTVLSATHINKLSNDAKNILADNYNTVDYCRQMLNALNSDIHNPEQQKKFRQSLEKQTRTITEVGEQEITDKIKQDFALIVNSPDDSSLLRMIQKDITDVMLLNMQAIQRKNEVAEKTADKAILWIAVTGTFCFIIAFTLLINLPSNIANPIRELTESIKEIAAKNYSRRVHFEEHNEYGDLAKSFNTMAKKLEEYSNSSIERLMMAKTRIETLINNMSEPVIGLDEKHTILFMNDIALKIAGLQKDNVIGVPIKNIAKHNDLIKNLIQDLPEKETADKKQKSFPIKIYADNKESYFEKEIIPILITPTGEKEEKHIGNVILLQNITPYKELDFAKTNFLATVSHELKTPISSIQMSLQLLENKKVGELNREQQSLLHSINDDTGRLLKITGELLNMTQVESGTIQISVVPSEAKEIVEYAVNATKAAAEQKQIKFKIKIADNLPQVLADNEKTAWVLTNLLSNAIRYSYDNSIISIDVKATDNKVRFSVTDTGQGISPQYIDKIFDRYFRIPGTKKEGTGLGLSISKEFIQAQGGEISVKSDLGAGSTFTFSLNSLQSNNNISST
ncbi:MULTISPECIES: ATP-binding protein [Chryseobacterium group]|uniref:ATP-binding protein n=1 Tax=Candidatus Kaistella beijingensis TaxID=2820270 RepID=UPI0009681578|nr:ATP-binding protein [Candidatus Kaistella beijingensis]MBN9294601.1 HAMP domain-containing protein [Flavobacteriia bacterium]OJX36309.1 MAG: PAS domain-containing sensor histidine kinase [Flavobacteriia bacterium 40-80]UBB89978.1 HAMP domain-containing protein [Candidatus Kaistella beijingensis]